MLMVERDHIDCVLIVIDYRVNVMINTHILIGCLYVMIVGGCNCVYRATRPYKMYIELDYLQVGKWLV